MVKNMGDKEQKEAQLKSEALRSDMILDVLNASHIQAQKLIEDMRKSYGENALRLILVYQDQFNYIIDQYSKTIRINDIKALTNDLVKK
jgi:hypothetical protein